MSIQFPEQHAVPVRTRVVVPVFFHKLAEHGTRPGSQAEADALLRIGERLFLAHMEQQAKQAASRSSLILAADAQLSELLGEKSAAAAYEDAEVHEWAAQYASDPELLKSAAECQRVLDQAMAGH